MAKMEGINQISPEQQKRQEKSSELFEIVKSLYESNNSNDAYEFRESVKKFESKFNNDKGNFGKSLVLKDYLLGRVLCDLDNEDYDQNSPLDKDGEIEKFIKDYYDAQKEK